MNDDAVHAGTLAAYRRPLRCRVTLDVLCVGIEHDTVDVSCMGDDPERPRRLTTASWAVLEAPSGDRVRVPLDHPVVPV